MRRRINIHRMIKVLSAIALSVFACVSYSAVAPGGSLIVNQAGISYSDGVNNYSFMTAPSTVAVASVPDLSLTSDQNLLRPSGVAVNIPHRLENTGNITDSFNLTVTNLAGDNYDFTGLAVHHDVNGNGVVDAGEPALTSTSALAPGQFIELVITGNIPVGQPDADVGRLQIQASSVANPAVSATNTDTVTITSGVVLDITKSSSPTCTVPVALGGTIDYSLRISNVGTLTPTALAYQISGTARLDRYYFRG